MLAHLRRLASRLHNDTEGAMSVEKIMIIALIALPIVIVLLAFRDKLKSWFSDQSTQLSP